MPDYPGLGYDLRAEWDRTVVDYYPVGLDSSCPGAESSLLLVREVAMMIVMDRLTDKPNFHIKVFDDAITSKWIEEGLAIPVDQLYDGIVRGKGVHSQLPQAVRESIPKPLKTILDRECMEYCIQELRAKAEFFKRTGLVPTLDASASVAKSDAAVDETLKNSIQAAFTKLKADFAENPDWHPRTNEMAQDLVHPSLYPLVYGKTRVFADEVVGVEDAIDKWAGRGEVIPKPTESGRQNSLWSETYQWLPSNVKLQEDGSVKFTSYINNLHPTKHRDIYSTIEKLIEKALPAWDLCLSEMRGLQHVGGGRSTPRFYPPPSGDDDDPLIWDPLPPDMLRDMAKEQEKDGSAPPDSGNETKESKGDVSGKNSEERGDAQKGSSKDRGDAQEEDSEEDNEEDEEESDGYVSAQDSQDRSWYSGTRENVNWKRTREPLQPRPPGFVAWDYGVQPGNSLRERFDGLQIIVKMSSIELTPEKPSFPPGGWHVEGQMNEHIIGTALYYLDSENVTSSHLHFRMQTLEEQEDLHAGQDAYGWLERVYGTRLALGDGNACIQNYGSVETRPGRLLAFPNVFQHRVSPFELIDKTKPGHRRFIALWLVDPHLRIISTANVPPQQQSWWMENTFDNITESQAEGIPPTVAQLLLSRVPDHPGLQEVLKTGQRLPQEITDMVKAEVEESFFMTLEEANQHRLALMDERTETQGNLTENWFSVGYSFCEH